MRYIKPATSFRSGFAYDNILYMVAGQLIESVTGETWEKFTANHVLKAAGMPHSTTDDETRFATADRAQPHARMNGGMRGVGDQSVEIAHVKGTLTIDFKSTPRMGGTLEHWQYDSFITRFDDKTIEPA